MSTTQKEPAPLLERLTRTHPLLVAAMNEVDETLLHEFAKLSFEEKIEWATQSADTLEAFRKQ
jgi:hypothetical protein